MSHVKNQHKNLLITDVTGKIMEYLMGRNRENELHLRVVAEKTSGKLVREYFAAIKSQNRKIRKEQFNQEKKLQAAIYFSQGEKHQPGAFKDNNAAYL